MSTCLEELVADAMIAKWKVRASRGSSPDLPYWRDMARAAIEVMREAAVEDRLDRFWRAMGERKGSVLPHDIAHMLDEFGLKLVSKT